MKIKLQILKTSTSKIEGCLIISSFLKYKVNLEKISSSKIKGIKDVLKYIKNITNPLILKIISSSMLEKINIELSFKKDSNPYLIFSGHILLLDLRRICYKYFKKIQNEKYKILLEESARQEIIISIKLGKLLTIILQDSFKKLLFKINY